MEILIRINNLKGKPIVEVDYTTYTIIIKIPKQLASMGVVEDLLELIIPIGMGYRIISYISITDGLQDYFWFEDKISKGNYRLIPTYKLGVGGPKMRIPTEDSDFPSLHLAPGVMGEIATISSSHMDSSGHVPPMETFDDSIWPDEDNESQGALIHHNIVTTLGEVKDSKYDERITHTSTGNIHEYGDFDPNNEHRGHDGDTEWQLKKKN